MAHQKASHPSEKPLERCGCVTVVVSRVLMLGAQPYILLGRIRFHFVDRDADTNLYLKKP